MAAVRDLGYTPNFGARALAARRTNTIGAIIPTMENAIFARGIQAFQEALHDRGYTLLIASSSYDLDLEEEQIRALAGRGADGLLLIGHDRNPEAVAFLDFHRIPVLAAWSVKDGAALQSVGFDNRQAMRDLASAVLGLGHRRIGMITAATGVNDRARFRVEGVRAALEDAGLGADHLEIEETVYSIEAGAVSFGRLMARGRRPTAVLCGNDVLAVGALMEARRLGLSVPDDVSVTGFDDIDLAQTAFPSLTTVHVPHREMGRQAACILIDMVENGIAGRSVELATEIRLRQSLGPPPSIG